MMRIRCPAFLPVLVLAAIARCGGQPREVAVVETDVGRFVVRFYEDAAPEHVRYFKVLSRSGSYDGTPIERIVPGEFFVTGEPGGRTPGAEDGRPAWTLRAELSRKRHRRGVVSMARGRSIDSSGGRFFVCLRDLPRLDGLFTAFGEVIEGIETVDRIGTADVDSAGHPVGPIRVRRVTIEARPPGGDG
jgi:cyclophilin family peptidyl-prolyl cis-trans isomerase